MYVPICTSGDQPNSDTSPCGKCSLVKALYYPYMKPFMAGVST